MAGRAADKPQTVARSVARQGGGYLVVTLKGLSAVSLEPIPDGARIFIRDGRAVRTA